MAKSHDTTPRHIQSALQAQLHRRDMVRWMALGAGTASVASLALSTGAQAAPLAQGAAVQQGGTFQHGITDVSTLNPFVSNSQTDSIVLAMLYPTLASLDKESNRVPYMAESWEMSPDGLKNTFRLRQGFLWEDGKPVTAHDVKFTADYETQHKFSFKASILAPVASIETPDDYTVVFNMAKPVGTFIYDFAWWFRIMPKHIWETIADPKTYPNDQPIGAGPFRLSRWEKTQFIELEARKDYNFPPVERPPYVDKVIYRIYPDVNTLVLAFQNGDIDAVPTGVPVDTVDVVKADPTFEVVDNPSTGYTYISPNIAANPHLADVKVRRALAMGIDKDVIVQLVYKGYAGKMTTVVSPILPAWHNPNVQDWPFDIEAGKKLLDEAGYTDTDGNNVRNAPADRGGGDLELRFSYSANDPVAQKVAAIQKENWEKMGIKIALDAQETNALYQRVRFDRDFDLWFSNWGIVDNPPRHYYSSFHPSQYNPGSNNVAGLQDQAFADLIEQTHFQADPEAMIAGVFKLQEMEHEILPIFALYYPRFILAYNKRWEGFEVLPGSLLGIASYQSMVNIHQKQ